MGVRRWARVAALSLGAGCVLPLALVSSAGAFVDPATMKKLSVVAKVGAQVGTKLTPLRMVASANPVGLVVNGVVMAGALYLGTDHGQAMADKAWNWITGGPKPAVQYPETGPYTNEPQVTTVPTRNPDYCKWNGLPPTFTAGTATVAASLTHGWAVQNFSPATGPLHVDCDTTSATGNWYTICKATVTSGSKIAGQVYKGGNGTASGNVTTGKTIAACADLPLATKPVIVSLEWYVTQPDPGASFNSFYVTPIVHYNPALQVAGQDGALASATVLTIRKDCKNITTGAVTTVQASGAAGTANIPGVECPAGTYPVGVRIYSSNGMIDSQGSQTKLLNSTTIPEKFRTEYPNCLGPNASGCQMWVEIDGQECAYGVAGCATWWDVYKTAPSRVRCKWGPLTASPAPYNMQVVTDCAPLRHAYVTESGAVADPQRSPDTLPVPNVAPITAPVTDPVAWPIGQPYPGEEPVTSPGTGTTPTTGTNPIPSTGTNPGTAPGTNPGTRPGPDAVPGGDPLASGDPANCWAETWTWNPISWVFTPVKCAMVWAFVPQPASLAATSARFKASVNATAVGVWSNAFAAYPAAFTVAGGADCMGPAMTLGDPFNVTLHPAQSCTGPAVMLANVCKFGVGALLAVAGAWACARLILAGVGYNIGGGGDSA